MEWAKKDRGQSAKPLIERRTRRVGVPKIYLNIDFLLNLLQVKNIATMNRGRGGGVSHSDTVVPAQIQKSSTGTA